MITIVPAALRLVRAKDLLNNPVAGYYRGMILNLAFGVGGECMHVGELQLHLRTIHEEKKIAHVPYGIGRSLLSGLYLSSKPNKCKFVFINQEFKYTLGFREKITHRPPGGG